MSCRALKHIGAFLAAVLLVCMAAPALGQDASIQNMVNRVSQTQYQTYQLAIQDMGLGLYGGSQYNHGFRNRDGWAGDGTLGNQEARLYLADQFAAMGLTVSVQGAYKNVVSEMRGTETPNNVYIIGGHYDHVGGDCPGGDDNASGVAGVLEAARILSQYQFKSTIRFIGFNAEEDGELGSNDYVSHLNPGETVAGMVNLDMILRPGWDNNPSHVKDLNIQVKPVPACQNWVSTFVADAATYVPSLQIAAPYSGGYWGYSDHEPFANAGMPAFLAVENTALEVWGGANAYYHGYYDASDRLANDPLNGGVVYDYSFAADVVSASVATVGAEAVVVPEPATLLHPGDANNDGAVDVVDLGILARNYDATGAAWTMGDFNNDGAVDVVDLAILAQEYDWVGAPAGAIPEPATLSLLAIGALLMRRRA